MNTMTRALVAEALFVSDLQPSQTPTTQLIHTTVEQVTRQYGTSGCAALMAAEFGDHPELAVRRMSWVHRLLDTAGG